MIDGRSILAVVAARGGSKGLPRKNVLPVGGRPMIAWSLEAAHASGLVDRTVVSTDDEEIAAFARLAGGEVPFLRPAELAGDTASIYDVLFHALDAVGGRWDYVVLLQATSPLRTGADIDATIRACAQAGAPAALTVTTPAKPPHWMVWLDEQGRMRPVLEKVAGDRRQEMPQAYVPNGAVYVAEVDWLRGSRSFSAPETRAVTMPPERSVDVDSRLDLLLADALMQQG